MAQNKNAYFLRRAKVKAHSTFHCVVMGANAKRGSRTQNEIVASKRELPVKTLNIRILT